MAVRVILDSNFLFVPLQFQIDIFEEIRELLGGKVEFIVLSTTIEELRKLVKKGGEKLSRQAAFALKMADKCRIFEVERLSGESNDDVIVRVAKKFKCAVATNDRTLKRMLRNMGVAVIYVRGKSRLEMEGTVNNV
ncbi:30S processome protein Utp24 [Candidatus Bathyarchaeota archaeon]|nr:MAG: 30S processome protein Utp24 [Candidatus Bathyarchaeota archaeon]